jgi:hypothetical protein
VGVTWLGAAAVRVATLRVDRPTVTASYWVYLGLEVACGAASLSSAATRRRGVRQTTGPRLPSAWTERHRARGVYSSRGP